MVGTKLTKKLRETLPGSKYTPLECALSKGDVQMVQCLVGMLKLSQKELVLMLETKLPNSTHTLLEHSLSNGYIKMVEFIAHLTRFVIL